MRKLQTLFKSALLGLISKVCFRGEPVLSLTEFNRCRDFLDSLADGTKRDQKSHSKRAVDLLRQPEANGTAYWEDYAKMATLTWIITLQHMPTPLLQEYRDKWQKSEPFWFNDLRSIPYKRDLAFLQKQNKEWTTSIPYLIRFLDEVRAGRITPADLTLP